MVRGYAEKREECATNVTRASLGQSGVVPENSRVSRRRRRNGGHPAHLVDVVPAERDEEPLVLYGAARMLVQAPGELLHRGQARSSLLRSSILDVEEGQRVERPECVLRPQYPITQYGLEMSSNLALRS